MSSSFNYFRNKTPINVNYKKKLKRIKKLIDDYVIENAALCDQVSQVQENMLIAKEERRFLLKKLYQYEPQSEPDVKPQIQPTNDQKKPTQRKHQKPPSTPLPTPSNILGDAEQKPAIPKPRKTTTSRMRKKVVQQIPLDCTGRPVFPIELGGLTVHSLGEVVTDRPEFHTEDVIYPVGYVSTRVYGSLKDPIVKCVYTCKISDHNGVPRFDITADNNLNVPIIGSAPDICHTLLLQHINDSLQMDVVNIRPRGNEFFGLSHPTILNLIQSSPGTRKCLNYKWTKFEVGKNPDNIDENDPCLNFDSLQRNINFSNLNTVADIKLEPSEDFMENADSLRDFLLN